ncbi:hypothetical protein Btru_045426 [Bulinus truncatus]|nr:hypothetical protein Btru_045426 [Bulinus truncatus]
MDYSCHVGDTLVFFVRYDPSIFKDKINENFYIQVFSMKDNKVYYHCLSTIDDEERYPVTFLDDRTTKIKTPRYFSRVRVFQFPMLDPGEFRVTVKPTSGGLNNPQGALQNESKTEFNWLDVQVTSSTDDICLNNATFTIANKIKKRDPPSQKNMETDGKADRHAGKRKKKTSVERIQVGKEDRLGKKTDGKEDRQTVEP